MQHICWPSQNSLQCRAIITSSVNTFWVTVLRVAPSSVLLRNGGKAQVENKFFIQVAAFGRVPAAMRLDDEGHCGFP